MTAAATQTESYADGLPQANGRWGLRDRIMPETEVDRDLPFPAIEVQADEWTLAILGGLRDARRVHHNLVG